jgi:hypothetical protein
MASPAWWPRPDPTRSGRSAPPAEIGLLDVRDGLCRVSFVDPVQGLVEQHCEPAVLRRSADGSFSHWGRRALAWQDRLQHGQVCQVFPSGWPVEPAIARRYLKRLHETYLSGRSCCRIFLLESQPLGWVRELWRETLEDTAFALRGFLAPWQHDILLVKGAQPEQALSPFVHFRVEPTLTSWSLIKEGAVVAEGQHPGLSEGRLLSQLGEYLRRHSSIEAAPVALRSLLVASRPEQLPPDRTLTVHGRQVLAGLPTRQSFVWDDFLATQPSVVESWRQVKSRLTAQATEVSGWEAGRGEGLDLPGWRILTSGLLAPLLVEGPVVGLWDKV